MSKSKEKGHDYSDIIIWSSAFVGMIRYAAAYLAADLGMIEDWLSQVVTVLLGVSGFAMGILGTLGTAYIFDGWRQKMPAADKKWSSKFKALTGFVAAAFLTEILILVPFTMSRVLHVSVAHVLQGGVWWWSTAVVVMPILLIGGVSLGNQIVTVETSAESFRQLSEPEGKVSDKLPKGWRQVRKGLTAEQVKAIAVISTKEIAYHYKVDERTARNWRTYAQKELETTTTTSEVVQK